ncbi:MAG: protein kinase, partial [Pirellulaceae bacterium]
ASTAPYLRGGSTSESSVPGSWPTIDGFEIESVLGRGGMGIVYKAWQKFPRRPVALKMILDRRLVGDSASEEFFERFQKEAQAVADLQDPHFVQLYAYGEAGGRPYMALEFVDGGSLEKFRQGEPQPEEFAADTVAELARGMELAHRAGIVHRDLKPHNVLLGARGQVKISDFGLVKRLSHDAQLTTDGRPMGTPSYMAPEQTYGTQDVGPPADIYALGGVLYCLLTGRPPFQAANWRDTFDQVCHQEPVPPSRLNPRISRDLETICLKCLQKEPDKRYRTAGELAEDLRRFRAGEPILARPVGAAERAWRWARRNPWVAGLSSAVAALTVTIATVSSVMWWRLDVKNQQISQQNGVIERRNSELSQANTQLKQARTVTLGQRNASIDLVRNTLLAVDELLRDQAPLDRLRRQLIDQALRGLDHVRTQVEAHPLTDAEDRLMQRTEAVAFQRFGDMYLQGDRLADAREAFDRAYEILAPLPLEDPDDPIHLRNLAAILNQQGHVQLRLGNTAVAREKYAQALRLREQWSQRLPEHAPARESIAESHGLLAKVDRMTGRAASAAEHLAESQRIFDALPQPADKADAIQLNRKRAANKDRLGEIHYRLGDAARAEQLYREALADREKALAEHPQNRVFLHDVALSHMSLGNLLLLVHNQPGQAWQQYTAALGTFLKLANDQPTSSRALRDYAGAQYRLGATFRRARQQHLKLPNGQEAPDPLPHFEEARKRREKVAVDPQDFQSRIELALAVARCQRWAEAERLALELAAKARETKDSYLLFQVACTWALCADVPDTDMRDRCRDAAFQVLDELLASGWQDLVTLQNDPDLDPIRSDARFARVTSSVLSSATPAP